MRTEHETGQKRLLTAEDFNRITCVGELCSDPAGGQVAWRETYWDAEKPLPQQDYIQRIHWKNLQTGTEEIITAGGNKETRPCILADGTVLFLSNGPDAAPLPEPGTLEQRRINELYIAPQLYRWDQGNAVKLTHFLHGVEEFQVSPDERYALLTVWRYEGDTTEALLKERTAAEWERLSARYRSEPVLIDKAPFREDRELGYSSNRKQTLWLLDLTTNGVRYFLDEDCSCDEPVWTPDGNAILCPDTDESGTLRFLRKAITAMDSHQPGNLLASIQGIQEGFDGLCPSFSADRCYLLFAGNLPEDKYNMPKLLCAIPASGREALEPILLINPEKTIDGIMPDTFMWTKGDTGRDFVTAQDGYCYFTSGVHGSLHLFRVPINDTGMADPELLLDREGTYTNLIPLEKGGFLCIYSDPVTLPEIARIQPDMELELLTNLNPWLKERAITRPIEIWAETENGKSRTHIKYGHIVGDKYFVIKVASGFQDNPQIGLPSGSGIVLVFSAETGFVKAILADDGYITDIRTAAAGAVVARSLGPKQVEAIGILGSGLQARLQLEYLKEVTDCRTVWLYGRNIEKTAVCKADMEAMGFQVTAAESPAEVAAYANLIVTTTCAKEPLLYGGDIRPGTHITAMGTDAPGKNEIHTSVFSKADVIVADSISQCVDHGDIFYAVKNGTIQEACIRELGCVLIDSALGRTEESQITIADLTGVAVQDIAVAELVMERLEHTDR